jgi:S-adenosyl-L-methionine hydrolase (adenosine-forming)
MPIITLLTDFGTSDSYVAEVKGVLLSGAPGATLVDVSHAVPPGSIATAAYLLGRTWKHFPVGTVHFVVVDPGVGTTRRAVAVARDGQFFVAPDNGVLTPVFGTGAEVWTLAEPEGASPTFHGRDLFAPAAARLANGATLADVGAMVLEPPVLLAAPLPLYEGKKVHGEILHVDRYGNLVTTFTPALVPPYAILESEDMAIGPIRRTFGDVAQGELLAYWGSSGLLEVAVRDGSAARRLGIGVGGRVTARLG